MTTKITDKREVALRIGYDATDWTKPMTFEAYQQGLADWDVQCIERDDEPIGAIFRKGDELHLSVLPKWRGNWLTKGLYKELFLGKKVVTQVTPGFEQMYAVLERIGFRKENGVLVKE